MLFSARIGPRLAIGWVMGTVVSMLGMYVSVQFDLPTGAAIVLHLRRRAGRDGGRTGRAGQSTRDAVTFLHPGPFSWGGEGHETNRRQRRSWR
jgi:hypothetical protein